MRKLKLDLSELIYAFEAGSLESKYYLDLETGEVVLIADETRMELNAIYERLGDAEDADGALFAEALHGSGLPDWQVDLVREADLVERGFGARFIEVPHDDSHEGYRDMEAFIETVSDDQLQARLSDAIDGRGAFRRFKDVLLRYPQERDHWFAFKETRVRQRALEWLESEEIEATDE
jgi:Uncharacterised protein family (UPF0158)